MVRFLGTQAVGGGQVPGFVPPPIPTFPAAVLARAQRIISTAGTITPIDQVAAIPITVTPGASAGNSLLDPSITFGSDGKYNVQDATRFEQIAGLLAISSGNTRTGQGRISNVTTGTRGSTFGNGVRFRYAGKRFEFFSSGSGKAIVYLTNPATGVRERGRSLDFTTGTNVFVMVDLGSYADRIIEVAQSGSNVWRGFVPESGYDFTLPPARPSKPSIVLIGDSWYAGTLSAPSGQSIADTGVKIGVGSMLGAYLGDENAWISSTGGTGHLFGSPAFRGTSGATAGGYRDRVNPTVAAVGDIDVSLVGARDAIIIRNSLNDNEQSGNTNKPTDAEEREETRLATQAAMAKQPNALIIGMGPQRAYNGTTGTNPTQARYDACRDGFLAAIGSDPRCVWVDISPAGYAVYADTAANAQYIGQDGVHPTDAGMRFYAQREANAIIGTLKAKYGL
ncbi:SGNH/GDSL hydrolase family protein [Sphingomonas sanguinis]|uniref:SGNH/GDSL hydrolase family protein n=1 Tax=Sphingomonas sanguinis TaxID=33051 RepID=UPI001C596CD2|nr:SGNH/GDSL hydrolase family protein [Sphingomonas sanguinis]QXT36842.1 SGNH/GDSL hydrolase family protein [Sphingomonas sanguinis]